MADAMAKVRNIKLTIEYEGTNYCGWQRQANGVSVQGKIEGAIGKTLGQKATLTGASRTDSGVHAKHQVASVKVHTRLGPQQIMRALNSALPSDIAIRDVREVADSFNARFDAKSKRYRYDILNDTVHSPLERHYSHQHRGYLNVRRMREEAKTLLGTHDFKSFQAKDKYRRKSITSITAIAVKKVGRHIYIDICARGFVYNMVRNIVGTLIEVGRGRLQPGDVKKILRAKNRTCAGPTAPAKGLCLVSVEY